MYICIFTRGTVYNSGFIIVENELSEILAQPICDKYANNTVMGPKVSKIIKSPSPMYLKPIPPVYMNDNNKPTKNNTDRISLLSLANRITAPYEIDPVK